MKTLFKYIRWEVIDDVGHLVISDPPANKITKTFIDEFNIVCREIIVESDAKGILTYGKGRHFSSGVDVDQLRHHVNKGTLFDEEKEIIGYCRLLLDFKKSFSYLNKLQMPVVSAINGICYGGGLELALTSHIRICAKGALLSSPEITFGFNPGAGGTQRLPAIIGYGNACEMIISGKPINAKKALSLGLVDLVCNKNETVQTGIDIIRYITSKYKDYNKDYYEEYVEGYKESIKKERFTKDESLFS